MEVINKNKWKSHAAIEKSRMSHLNKSTKMRIRCQLWTLSSILKAAKF